MGLTVDTKMANSLPILNRNPYLLVALNPATVTRFEHRAEPVPSLGCIAIRSRGKHHPQERHHPRRRARDDGSEDSYTPPMDAVQEVNVQQNSIDAEFGT